MNINDMVNNLTPEVYENLKNAVETGKWPDGNVLNEGQKQQTLQLVMMYQSQVLKSEQHFTVGSDGEIVNRDKTHLKNQFKDNFAEQQADKVTSDPQSIKRFKHDDI